MPDASYAWTISCDHLDHKRTDISGPHNASDALLATLRAAITAGRTHASEFPGVTWFRMFDADGEKYYSGVRIGKAGEHDSEEGFEPLDDYGTPSAGAVCIQYWDPWTDTWPEL